ncbi:MAG: chemotaxis protein CheW [Deltaproteobacteria bacterium]|nr:chemotaxis protein CheW [Deltaproteobacteria bacterium]MBP7285356.1 chemotaxis protein CheW [Nannocystaceae bacterium]
MSADDELIREFLLESWEGLNQLDRDFVELERDPSDRNRLGAIFRCIHTIKGTAGFLALHHLEAVAHAGESLLSRLRNGDFLLDGEMTSALLAMVDAIRAMLERLETTGHEGTEAYKSLVEHLAALTAGQRGMAAPATPRVSPAPELSAAAQPTASVATTAPEHDVAPATASAPTTLAPAGLSAEPHDDADAPALDDTADESAASHEPQPTLAPAQSPVAAAPAPTPEPLAPASTTRTSQEPATMTTPATATASAATAPTPEPSDASPTKGPAVSVSDSAIRVDVGLLDRVMNLVGELVLARNQILQYGATVKDAGFANASQRLNLLTTELQEGVMKTRMQPIGNVWNKFPRVVRDLSHACSKKVDLSLDGTETELDRTIIEAIKDPLTHAVRNAVDHGLERPEARLAAGKSENGRLTLRAFHEGGQVNIEISDDGAGIDAAKVRARAVERGVISADRASRMSDREAVHLIFQPGFSTAEKVTNVSGRGVGMDVVKTNIEKIGGTVDIHTQLGQGTTLKLKIPLTLAIIPALIVSSGGNRFAIPQVSLLELVRLEGETAARSLESLHGSTVYRLRGNLLPLVFLDRALELKPVPRGHDVVNIVVLQADDRQFGLVVDGINDTEEIVVKPLGKELKGISAFAGATIMGDGRVALILDVLGIAQRSNVVSAGRERSIVEKSTTSQGSSEHREALLLFRLGHEGRMALPLSMVARLEEIPRAAVEHAAGREVVQYRGAILPLLDVRRALGVAGGSGGDSPLQVIVYSEHGRSFGFVVDQILDTVEETLTTKQRSNREGVLGSAVVQGKVTDILDVHGIIRRTDPSFFTQDAA